MNRLIVASIRSSAGKTSMIVGLGLGLGKSTGYLKPFGDRLLYRKKRLWDYDAALMENILQLEDSPEDLSIGFDHSKLRFMYDEAGVKEKLGEIMSQVEADKEVLLIEAGRSVSYGGSVHLDAISLARHTGGRLIFVIGADECIALDEAHLIKHHLNLGGIDFGGVIVNKIHDPEDFKNTYVPDITAMGIPVLGVVPYLPELTRLSVRLLADALFAKVLAGEKGLSGVVRNIFVGAMSTDAAMRNPFFGKKEKLVITSGDRSDMILTALEGDTVAIVVTNNIFPPAHIISLAEEKQTPILQVSADTFQVAKQIDDLERLLTPQEADKIDLLRETVAKNVDFKAVLGG